MRLTDKVKEVLDKSKLEYKLLPLPEDISVELVDHVRFHGIRLKDAVPTLIYKTEKGMIAVQRRADCKLAMRKLKELVGVKRLGFVEEADLTALGTRSGEVPMTGFDMPYFVDNKVLELEYAYGGAGRNTLAMRMKPADLVKINNAVVGSFTLQEDVGYNGPMQKKRILSGITPSGEGALHIGNYLGAVRQFIELARDNDCFLFVADLHALTTVQDKKQLQNNVETQVINELALLGDLKNITFFRQSDVPMHTELQSILNNITPLGLLKRAHAYKDKLAKDVMEDEINLGLFNYPILMAADILIYKPDLVPVGKDQKQHVEITRDVAERFNKTFKQNVFKLPDPYIPEEVAAIMGTDGKRKMSKSLGNIISIFEPEEVIRKQVNGTFTDPTRIRATDPGHIEGNMVFSYLDFLGDKTKVEDLKQQYREGKVSDMAVKDYLFEVLMQTFGEARARYAELKANPEMVKKTLREGAEKARVVAEETMKEVREAIGITNSYSFFEYGK